MTLMFLLLVVMLILQLSGTPGAVEPRDSGEFNWEALARRLEDRGLKSVAAETWERFLQDADLSPEDRAAKLFQIGGSIWMAEISRMPWKISTSQSL